MMRNHGVSNGRQVLPSWWVDDIRNNGNAEAWSRGELTKVFPNGNYRSKWYTVDRNHTPFAAVGIHGQWIYIDPANSTVVVRVSSQPLPVDLDLDQFGWRDTEDFPVQLDDILAARARLGSIRVESEQIDAICTAVYDDSPSASMPSTMSISS